MTSFRVFVTFLFRQIDNGTNGIAEGKRDVRDRFVRSEKTNGRTQVLLICCKCDLGQKKSFFFSSFDTMINYLRSWIVYLGEGALRKCS